MNENKSKSVNNASMFVIAVNNLYENKSFFLNQDTERERTSHIKKIINYVVCMAFSYHKCFSCHDEQVGNKYTHKNEL